MSEIKVFTRPGCPYCINMMNWLENNKIPHTHKSFTDIAEKAAWYDTHGVSTLPQLFVDGKRIGGWSDLATNPIKAQLEAEFKS